MPKIYSATATAKFSHPVGKKVLDAYRSAIEKADKVGLRIDVTPDVESMLRRVTKIIDDAAIDAGYKDHQEHQS